MYYSSDFSYVTGTTPEFLDMLEENNIDALDPISGIYDVKAPIFKIGIYGFDKMPETLLFAFAKLIDFYKLGTPNDDADVMAFMKSASVAEIMAKEEYWGQDLSFIKDEVAKYVNS